MQAYLLLHGMISNITSQQEENTYKTIFLFTVPSTKKIVWKVQRSRFLSALFELNKMHGLREN